MQRQLRMQLRTHRFGACSAVLSVLCTTLILGTAVVAQPAEARSVAYNLDIPSQSLNDALQALALASKHRLLYSSELVVGKNSPAIKGRFTTEQAVKLLLSTSDLAYEVTADGLLLIRAPGVAASPESPALEPTSMSTVPLGAQAIRLAQDPGPRTPPQSENAQAGSNHEESYPSSSSAETGAKLEEIIVTSQKREEKLQDIPVSVQVLGGPLLQQQNYNRLEDAMQTVPAVVVNQDINGTANNLFIRGIGSGNNPSFDQSVATFYDDIYHGRSRTSGATFLDLDRVEVLKGPQSTFFGNNAVAGALNIVSKKPGDTIEGWGRMLYGQFGRYAVEGAVGGPITDTFGARIAVTRSGGSGWLDNVTLNEHVPRVNDRAARLTLEFKPTPELDATLKIEGSELSTVGLPLQAASCPASAPFTSNDVLLCPQLLALRSSGVQVPIGFNNNLTSGIAGAGTSLSTAESALTVNYNRWGHTFTSVTGFYNYHFNIQDIVPVPASLFNAILPENYHQFSQELRVASSTGGTIEYLAGVYFQSDHLFYAEGLNLPYLGPVFPGQSLGIHDDDTQNEHSYSAFGSATWNVSDRLKISGGIRGNWARKNYATNAFTGTSDQIFGGIVPQPDIFGPPTALSGNGSWHDWMPSAKLQYQLAPQVMAYFSYNKGWKEGGFNGLNPTANPADVPYGPEHVNAFELGLKSEWLDDSVMLDLAVFRSNYSGLQSIVEVINAECPGGCSFIRNAASSVTQGVELAAQWVITHHFQLSADVSYVDAYYGVYPNGPATPLYLLATGQSFENLSGTRIPGTPRWSGSLNAAYNARLPGNYKIIAQVLPYFSSNYYQDYLTQYQGAYTRLDARLALESPDGHWGLDLIGKNLTDRIIVVGPPGINLVVGSKEQPRNVAVQIRYKF